MHLILISPTSIISWSVIIVIYFMYVVNNKSQWLICNTAITLTNTLLFYMSLKATILYVELFLNVLKCYNSLRGNTIF